MTLPAAKYIRVFSDLHLDMDVPKRNSDFNFSDLWMPEPLAEDSETLLILAGDIWHAKKPFSFNNQSWIKHIAQHYQYVVILLGNHDFWGGNLQKEYLRTQNMIKEQKLDNVFLLQNNTLIFGDLKLVGGTLWTDFNGADPETLQRAADKMNDYKYITWGAKYQKLRATNLLGEFLKTKNYIKDHAKKDYPEQQLWVVTHHAPSFSSMDEQYNSADKKIENALYFSNLDADIEQSDIDVWVHGHSHHAKNYYIGKTNILANPRGYPSEKTDYNPWHQIQISFAPKMKKNLF